MSIKQFICRLIGAAEKEEDTKLDRVIKLLQEQRQMSDAATAQFQKDVTTLTADVQTNTAAIQQIGTIVSADAATIASLNQQIADLKAAQPTLDLSGFEASISDLEANNALAQSIVPVPPAPSAQPVDPAATT